MDSRLDHYFLQGVTYNTRFYNSATQVNPRENLGTLFVDVLQLIFAIFLPFKGNFRGKCILVDGEPRDPSVEGILKQDWFTIRCWISSAAKLDVELDNTERKIKGFG